MGDENSRSATAGAPALEIGTALESLLTWGRKATPPGPLSAPELSCLDALACASPLRVSDLVRRERLSQPGMTALVGRIVEAGLAERFTDTADRRVSWISITAAGLDQLQAVHQARAGVLAQHIATLPREQRRHLERSLSALWALAARPVSLPDQG